MPNFNIGIDLGKERDHTAVVIVERLSAWTGRIKQTPWGQEHDPDDHFHVRHIEKFHLGTPYTAVVERVSEFFSELEDLVEGSETYIDATGVGLGIFEMFVDAAREGKLGRSWPQAVTITGGGDGGSTRWGYSVPKRDLVSRLQALLELGRLKVAPDLPGADALQKELLAFRAKISKSGHGVYEAQRERDHDDLVLALALAVYFKHNFDVPRAINQLGQVRSSWDLGPA